MDDPYFQYYEMSYGLNVEMHKQVTSSGPLVTRGVAQHYWISQII